MNYFIFRFIMLLIVYAIIFIILIRKKILKNDKKNILKIIFILFIIYKIIWIFPYEGTILKFNNANNIITHFIQKDKIVKKYIFDDYAYVLYKNNSDFPAFKYFVKDEKNGWKLGNILHDGHGEMIQYNNCFITIIKIPSKQTVGIQIYNPMVDKNKKYEVYDSLNSKIDTYTNDVYKDYDIEYNEVINVIIINENLKDNYTLYIDGEKYKPFEKEKN